MSAVGHEIDVTISDLVADVRAATPSAAAETTTPNQAEVRQLLAARRAVLGRALARKTASLRRELDYLRRARPFLRPLDRIRAEGQRLDELADSLGSAMRARLAEQRTALDRRAGHLEALSPLKVLGRGYSVTLGPDGRALLQASGVESGDEVRTILRDGEIRSRVE